MLVTPLQGLVDKLARAVGGGDPGVLPVRRHQHQARGPRHLDDGRPAVAGGAPLGVHGLAQGAGDPAGEELAAGDLHQGLESAVAAVGYGEKNRFSTRKDLLDRLGHGPGGLHACKATLERLWGYYNLHGPLL